MTRGKYATRAEQQTAIRTTSTELEQGRRRVVSQQAEIKSLRAELSRLKAANADTTRVLKAQLTEGTSDALEAANRTLGQLRDEVGRARASEKGIRANWDKLFLRLQEYLMSSLGLTHVEVIETLSEMITGTSFTFNVDSAKVRDSETLRNIQRARGDRH